jgi:hypothetical protein
MAEQFLTDINSLSKGTQEVLAANAKAQGITAEEYLASRGGVNPVTRKYGDSYDPNLDLNDAEYMAAVAGKTGLDQGKALNAARAKKVQAYIAANPTSQAAIEYRQSQPTNVSNTGGVKTVSDVAKQSDGSSIVSYSDGTTTTLPAGSAVPAIGSTTARTTATRTLANDTQTAERQSAYDLLYSQFKLYGLESLVEPLKGLITSGASPAEFTIKLRESDSYKKRFSANAQRIAKGLRSLSEAEYIQLEDQYQDVMRRYGLPDTYYTKGEMGIQEGFNKFLEGDVSPVELEDRISTAQKRVLNANPEVTQALKQFYPDITNADILAYTLDPKNAIENIKRKVTTAEIGGAALQSGLQTGLTRAEELRAAGVTKDVAQQGFGTIAGGLQRGSQLASIYGEDPYNQAVAETEVFGLAGAQEAAKQRKKLTGLEKATFSGQSGISSGALVRDRAGAY